MQYFAEPLLNKKDGDRIWQAIQSEAKDAGLLAPDPRRVVLRLSGLLLLFAGSLYGAWTAQSLAATAASYLALSLLMAQFAFLAHDAGHRSLIGKGFWNEGLGHVCMTLITGMPFKAWYDIHHAHHQYCQNEGRDPDMAVNLFVSLTEESARKKGTLGRFFTRYQGHSLWFLSFLFAYSQRHQHQGIVLFNLKKYRLDALILIGHFALWLALPWTLGVSWGPIFAAYMLPLLILGPHLAAIFWINHIGMPIVREPSRFSFLEHQLRTSRTILNPIGLNWLFGGLNYQIEHHLLPQVPSHRLHRLQRITRQHLSRASLPYHPMDWWAAVKQIGRHVSRIAHAD